MDVDSEVSSTRLNIHIGHADEARAEPDLVADVEDEDDGESHNLEEEVLDNCGGGDLAVAQLIAGVDGVDGDPDLGDEYEDVADETDP